MFARSLPQLASLRPHLPRILGWFGLAAALAGWFWVALGPWMIGPSEWDDTMYAERAITAGFVWDVRNRYAHVWAIRILDYLAPSHRSAAAAWGALCVCGLAGLAFYAGRRIAGMRCGFAALALTLVFPPMLKYLSVPHVDFSMAFFSMLAVLAAALAVDAPSPRVARVAAVACGVFGYLAIKSKETGLAALPVCGYVLFGAARGRARWQSYACWILGLALGFALLYALDRAFFHTPVQHASDPSSYFAQTPKTSQPAAPHQPRAYRPGEHQTELMSVLLSPAFAAFTLLGCAGLVHAARRNVWARALALWCLAVLAFTALVSVRYRGVDAQDRYLVAAGAALAPLAASWLAELGRGGQRQGTSLLVFGLMVLLTATAVWGTWAVHLGTASDLQARAATMTTPLAMLLLFVAAWFTPRRWIALPAACVLIGISTLAVVDDARAYREQKRSELAPWIELAGWADAAPEPLRIAVLNGRSYRGARLRWRLRVLSRKPVLELHLRDIERADQLEPGEWVFVGASHDKGLEQRGYQRVLDLTHDPRPWSLYRK